MHGIDQKLANFKFMKNKWKLNWLHFHIYLRFCFLLDIGPFNAVVLNGLDVINEALVTKSADFANRPKSTISKLILFFVCKFKICVNKNISMKIL